MTEEVKARHSRSELRTMTTKAQAARKVTNDLQKSLNVLIATEEGRNKREGHDISALLSGLSYRQRAAVRRWSLTEGLRKALEVITAKAQLLEAHVEELRQESQVVPHYPKRRESRRE